jgi:hypothetical protein
MNEQIKLLAEKCNISTLVDSWEYEQFAELLILECINLVETTPKHCAYTTYDLGVVDCTVQKASERLHEHFGIKKSHKTTSERTRSKEIFNSRRSL